jgi:hypothetical protein
MVKKEEGDSILLRLPKMKSGVSDIFSQFFLEQENLTEFSRCDPNWLA